MKIRNYYFKQTCFECPEQYDVFDKHGKQVAYVRLRWGSLSVECPDVGGAVIYSAEIGNDSGSFRSKKQRYRHLIKIAERIEWYNILESCPYCGKRVTLDSYELENYMLELDDVGEAEIVCPECDRLIKVWDDIMME